VNAPLLGTWGGLLRSPASTLATCMSELDLPVIPFGQVVLCTDKFHAGG
jgi:hypothetical protein